ncbi:MAG TPA: protein-L-isoaspartate(D-aspartate) O-methyltransferase [Methanomicrobia archaeon]|nr:protein-L-isoaspartate(D-aspartate) O-methyltransferase [Methanomicrobia archaeon]
MEEERTFEEARLRMTEHLRRMGVHDRVVSAMSRVNRHLFVPEKLSAEAYADYPLPIGEGQTISAPHMVAMMCDYLEFEESEQVLEIGAGSGYHAAVVAELIGAAGHVYSVERIPWLVSLATTNLARAGYTTVTVIQGDGTLGLPEHAPFDKINVTCAAPDVPPPLLEQLKVGGKMVIPIGKHWQALYLVEKKNGVTRERKTDVAFVPLVGKYGFAER